MGAVAEVFCISSFRVALLAESQRIRGDGEMGRKKLGSPEKCTLVFVGVSDSNLAKASLA